MTFMTSKSRQQLHKSYTKYKNKKPSHNKVMAFFRAYMPEIIFRTTKLEGERVTRKMTKSLF
jgi:hypothetical protein